MSNEHSDQVDPVWFSKAHNSYVMMIGTQPVVRALITARGKPSNDIFAATVHGYYVKEDEVVINITNMLFKDIRETQVVKDDDEVIKSQMARWWNFIINTKGNRI